MKCEECRWFESQRAEDGSFDNKTRTWNVTLVGICRKHPPQHSVFQNDGGATSGWPTTRSTDWCGKWEDKIPNRTTTSGITLDDRIVQILKVWRDTHTDEKPMPRWKLRRSVARDNEAELAPALERLVKNGILEIVLIQTKGRPFSGCKLT